MSTTKVTCKKCSSEVVPRLWHSNNDSMIFNRVTEHICPICGETMYVTGGGLSPNIKNIGVFAVFVVLLAAVTTFESNLLTSIFLFISIIVIWRWVRKSASS